MGRGSSGYRWWVKASPHNFSFSVLNNTKKKVDKTTGEIYFQQSTQYPSNLASKERYGRFWSSKEWLSTSLLRTLSSVPRNGQSWAFSLALLNLKGNRCESCPIFSPFEAAVLNSVLGRNGGSKGHDPWSWLSWWHLQSNTPAWKIDPKPELSPCLVKGVHCPSLLPQSGDRSFIQDINQNLRRAAHRYSSRARACFGWVLFSPSLPFRLPRSVQNPNTQPFV